MQQLFTEDESDVLREIMNLHIGEAAAILSEMVDRRIVLAVPEIKLIRLGQNANEVREGLRDVFDGQVVSSSLSFGDDFSGRAYFVFPSRQARSLVALCLGQSPAEAPVNADLPFMDDDVDVVREIGNVILNSIIGGFSNILELRLNYSLPEVEVFDFNSAENTSHNLTGMHLLIIRASFLVEKDTVEGAVLIVFSLRSIEMLKAKMAALLLANLDG